jgi:hypothetical protein
LSEQPAWRISGSYLESCNCEAICPCRRIGGRAGGRSTYGICEGALSWAIREGSSDGVDLSGLGVVMAIRYSDDEPGSPWTYCLYIDDRAEQSQREALVEIFTGQVRGSSFDHFPWVWKASELVAWRAVPMEIEHTPRRGFFRAGEHVTLRIRGPVADQEPVTCVIPGHSRDGEEQIAEELRVDDGPLAFEVSGRCAYQSTFAYSG